MKSTTFAFGLWALTSPASAWYTQESWGNGGGWKTSEIETPCTTSTTPVKQYTPPTTYTTYTTEVETETTTECTTSSTSSTCGVYQISDGQPQWVPCPSTSSAPPPPPPTSTYVPPPPASSTPKSPPPPSSSPCGVYQISDGQPQFVPCSSTPSVVPPPPPPSTTYVPPPVSTTPKPVAPTTSSCVVYQISDGQPQYVPCGSTPIVSHPGTSVTPGGPIQNSTYVAPTLATSSVSKSSTSSSPAFTGAAIATQPDFAGFLGLAVALGYLVW